MRPDKIRSLIIDDDPFILDLLQDKLNQFVPEIELVGIAGSGVEGIHLIKTCLPDLVFLDVEMADMTGFEMLAQLDTIPFQTIFITSYSHYAVRAIRFNALDYLVKPIDLSELKGAIKRYQLSSQNTQRPNPIRQALTNLSKKNTSEQILTLQTQDGDLQLALKDIVRIEGERNYSYVHLVDNKKKLTSKTLGDLEELLDDKGFFRCHKSYLVNQCHINSYPNSFSVLLSDGSAVPISRRKKHAFQHWYSTYQG